MQRITLQRSHILALVIAGILATSPGLADKPSWAGSGKADKHEQQEGRKGFNGHERDRDEMESHDRNRGSVMVVNAHFGDRQRAIVHDYYAEQFRSGRCPPGLAKKHNGCMPPGQARKWIMGRPLPRGLIFYDLPSSVIVQLGPPPPRHRYVRVATDILLIAIGTGLVVDAIQDLGRM